MKFRKGNWKIDSKTLIRLEWNKCVPKLIIHEKYEKIVKWTLRILSFIGITTAFLTLPYLIGILLTFVIFFVEQFLEKTIFEYSVFYLFPIPDFDIEYDNWLTSGYLLINDKKLLNQGYLNHFGPAYENKTYAIKFFNYLRLWNNSENTDLENNICISLIIENDQKYSTYFYPNSNRKELRQYFAKYKKKMALEKYGKEQQEMIMQMIFWKPNQTQGTFFKQFISDLKINSEYFFAPFYIENEQPKMVEELKILKSIIKVKNRNELTEKDIEYHYKK